MWKSNTIRLGIDERAIVFAEGLPVRAIGPGTHRLARDETVDQRFDVTEPIFTARREVRAVLPDHWFETVVVPPDRIGVLFIDGEPVRLIDVGTHRFWRLDGLVMIDVLRLDRPLPTDPRILALLGERVRTVDVGPRQRGVTFKDGVPSARLAPGRHRIWAEGARIEVLETTDPPPTENAITRLLAEEIVQTIVGAHQRGLLFVAGRFEQVLGPGRHVFWNTADAPTSVAVIDMRRQILNVAGQELMTKDKVSLRLSLTVDWAPLDPEQFQVAADPAAAIYSAAQLALRDFVGGVTLDELLEGRDALRTFLAERVTPEAEAFGVRIFSVGVKDIMLPGEMKILLNRVIEAEKQAAANAILRRDEAQVARAQANAAQLMAERPMLLRLKELEALQDIAGRIDELKVIIGPEDVAKLVTRKG